MLFHALTFAGSRENCLNTRTIGRVLKHLPRDRAIVNAMKQTCVFVILGRVLKHLPRDRAIVNAMKQTCVLVILGLNTILFDKSQDML